MDKKLLLQNPLLYNRNISGGKNSTAKPVSITYGMTNEEIDKRIQYNLDVSTGRTNKTYEDYSKTAKPIGVETMWYNGAIVPATPTEKKKVAMQSAKTAYDTYIAQNPTLINSPEANKLLKSFEHAESIYNYTVNATNLDGGYDFEYLTKGFGKFYVVAKMYSDPNYVHAVSVEKLSEDNVEYYTMGQELGVIVPVFLTDEKGVCAVSRLNVYELSRENVPDVSKDTNVLFYDKSTGKLYEVPVENEHTAELRERKMFWTSEINSVVKELESEQFQCITEAGKIAQQLEPLVTKIESRTATEAEWQTYNSLVRQYSNIVNTQDYQESLDKYNELYNKLKLYQEMYDVNHNEYVKFYGEGVIAASPDWGTQLTDAYKQVSNARIEYKDYIAKYDKYYNTYDDPSEINSLGDGFKSAIGKWGSGKWWSDTWDNWDMVPWWMRWFPVALDGVLTPAADDFLWQGVCESLIWETVAQPIWGVLSGDIGVGEGFKVFGNNFLVQLGETFDSVNFLKPLIIGALAYRNPEVIAQSPYLQEAAKNSNNAWEMAENLFMQWTNAYDGTNKAPINADYIWLAGDDANGLDWGLALTADIMLDPANWFNFGASAVAKNAATDAFENSSEIMSKVLANAADGTDELLLKGLTKEQLEGVLLRAGKHAVRTGSDYVDDIAVQLAKLEGASSELKLRGLLRALPESKLTKVLESLTSSAELGVRRATYTLRHPIKSGAKKSAARQMLKSADLKNMLPSAYAIIEKGAKTYKALNYLDEVMFDSVMFPLKYSAKAVGFVSRPLRSITRKLMTTPINEIRKATFTKRIAERTKHLIDADGNIIVSCADEFINIVEYELKALDYDMYNQLSNTVHRAVRSNIVDTQLDHVLEAIDYVDDIALKTPGAAAKALNDLNTAIKAVGTETMPINTLEQYLYFLKKPLGDTGHSIYDMLDSSVISKLRTLQTEYNRLVRISALDDLATLTKGIDDWRRITDKSLMDFTNAIEADLLDVHTAQAELVNLVSQFESAEKFIVEGYTAITKLDIQKAARTLGQELNNMLDGLAKGQSINRAVALEKADALDKLITKYVNDTYDVYARRYLPSIDSKIDRAVIAPAVRANADEVYDAFVEGFSNAIKNKYGVELVKEQLSATVLAKLDTAACTDKIKFRDATRIYPIIPEKSSKALAYISDAQVAEHLTPFIGANSVIAGALDTLVHTKGGIEANTARLLEGVQKEAITLHVTSRLFQHVVAADIDSALKTGILDALSGEQKYINDVFRRTDMSDTEEVVKAVNRITNHLIDKAAQYITRKDGSYGIKLFSPMFDGTRVRMCSLDTNKNVENMMANLDKIPGALKYLSEDLDEYCDIYFSLSRVSDDSVPYSITFGHGEEVVTFKNSQTKFRPTKLMDEYVRNTHGISLDAALEEYAALDIASGLRRADFDEAISAKLLEYKELASKENKKIRFIGYNNGVMGTRQDATLRAYIAKNALPVHNDLTIDLADFLRIDNNLPVMTTGARSSLFDGVRKYFNISATQGTYDFLSTFDNTLFATANTLVDTLIASQESMTKLMTKSYYASVTNAVVNLKSSVDNVTSSITASVKPLADVCIREKVLTDILNELMPSAHLTGINVHALLEEAYKYAGIDYALNAYKLVDSAKYSYLFDLDELSKTVTVKELNALREVSNKMLGTISKIKQPEVLAEVGASAYKALLAELLKDKRVKVFLDNGRTDIRVIARALDNANADEMVYFSACRYIFTTSAFEDPKSFIKAIYKKNDKSLRDALYTVRYANETILNSGGGSFTHAHRMLESKVYGELTDHAEVLAETIDLQAYTTISEYITRKTDTYAKHNFISAAEQIGLERFKEVAEPYLNFVKQLDVKALPPSAFGTRLEYVKHLHGISGKVAEAKANMKIFGDMHREAAMRTVFSLSDEDFFVYLVKDCKNNLIVDVNSKYMQNKLTRTLVFNKLDELKASGLFEVDEGADGIIKIFHHTDKLKDTDMDTFYATLLKKHVDYREEYFKHRAQVGRSLVKKFVEEKTADEVEAFKDLLERYLYMEASLSKAMPDNWIVSTFTANTQATAEHLQEIFPKAARLNLDDLNQYGFFNDAFTCSVWADSNIIRSGDFIQYYSDDIVKSMGNGLYQVRNNLEAIKNKFALYSNERMSLGYIVEHAQFPLQDYKQLNEILEHDGLILHRGWVDKWDKLHVERVTVESNAQLSKVLKDKSVIISPYDVYSEMVQYCKSTNYKIKVDSMLEDSRNVYEALSYGIAQQRIAFSTGALFTRPGTWFKNYPDSFLKAWMSTNDVALLPYYARAGTLLDAYEEVFAKVTKEYHRCGASEIARFFKEFPDQTCGLSQDTMFKIYAHKTSASAGSMASTIISMQNEAVFNKLLGLCTDTPEITEEMLQDVIRVYHKEARKANVHPGRDFIKHKNNVRVALEAKGYSGELLEKFTNLYYSYTASSSALTDFLYNSPSLLARFKVTKAPDISTVGKVSTRKSALSNYITFNSNMFSAAEDRVRLAMFLYYTDELGTSASRASMEVVKTQFDYTARSPLLDTLEGVFPFITFSLYNTKYWLFDAPKQPGSMRAVVKATMATEPYYDTEELMNIMRGEMLRDKLASGELVTDEDGTINYEDSPSSVWAAFAHTILGEDGVVEEYQGQLRREAQLTGSIPLGDRHVLKMGNTFLDALDFAGMVTFAVPQVLRGEVPDLLKEKVYTPIRVALGAFEHYATYGFNQEALNKWVSENWYDIFASIPFYGALVNNAITHMKNGNLNLKDLWVIASNPQLKDELMHTIIERVYCVAGALVPSIVGTVYEDDYFSRPIGYDWYNQDEEYRKTHRYVWGVSYVPKWLTKNPGTYVDYLGKYMALGYTRDEAMKILNTLFGDNPNAPVKWGFDQELFDETLKYLVQRGYSLEEALTLLSDKALWDVGELAKQLGAINQKQAMENSVFYRMYGMLPDYIKYTDGQYGQLMSHYRSLGYSEEQSWAAMWTGAGFIDPLGNYKSLTPEQVTCMNKEVNDAYAEFMLGLPDWYKYEPGAATRTVKYLKETHGMDTEQARKYIINNNFYVTEDGEPTYYTASESAERTQQSNKEFQEYYSTLPDYIKYEAGAFSRTLSYLKVIGYDQDTAKELIKNGMYLTLDGELIDCTNLSRKKQYNTTLTNNYRKAYRLYVPRPKYTKKRFIRTTRTRRPYKMRSNNSMTYSLVNVRNGSNFGTRKAYKVTLGYNSAASILSTKGNYPSAWRNVAQAYRRNMYKEHYAKYGMSRIDMRSGVWKGYSNASVTRLRRENIYAARRYRNRRVF